MCDLCYFFVLLSVKNGIPCGTLSTPLSLFSPGFLFCMFCFCFIEFKGFPRQDLRSPDRGDLRNGFVVCDCELDKD